MRDSKAAFADFLTMLMDGRKGEELLGCPVSVRANMFREDREIKVEDFTSFLSMGEEYNVRTAVMTNCMEIKEGEKSVLYATAHHLFAIDEQQQLFPFLFGGKYRFVLDEKGKAAEPVQFDLEYVSGNTILTMGKWLPLEKTFRLIDNRPLRRAGSLPDEPQQTVYRFFWAVDTMDAEMFRENVSKDIRIVRAGVDGDFYGMEGIGETEAFLQKDKSYYSQNQYSIHIEKVDYRDDRHVCIQARHLYPANTGNKHLGSQNKFSQFYNEILTLELEKEDRWRVRGAEFKRKENPVPYGYRTLEL